MRHRGGNAKFMKKQTVSPHSVSVAAEAIAAAQFARCGFDVSVQYGANQPEYDLIVAKGDHAQGLCQGQSRWKLGLTQSLLKDPDYHGAIDAWLRWHGSRTV